MVGPWGRAGRGEQRRRSQDARQERRRKLGLALGNAEPGRRRGRESKSPPPRREAQGRNEVYEGNAFLNKDLNKAYLMYKKKRLRKKGKLFEEKEEASLYTRTLTLLINPDNVTGKQEKQNENETRKEQAKNGDRNVQENRNGEQKRGETRIAEHTPTRNRTEADEDETGKYRSQGDRETRQEKAGRGKARRQRRGTGAQTGIDRQIP
ncbi:hypothetical protein DFP73DRAFT_593131 [Morchella snyderi]|nr:hypothetical protein DFP73DRAFT_593131 [Morchella snyderi]